MKTALVWAIVKNIGRLLSYDFWLKSLRNKDFPTMLFIRCIVFCACQDILLMLIKPGYPDIDE